MTHMPAVAVDRGGGGRHTSQGQDGSLGGTMAPDVQHVLLKVTSLAWLAPGPIPVELCMWQGMPSVPTWPRDLHRVFSGLHQLALH